jgi:HK97 family phage major capsid protein
MTRISIDRKCVAGLRQNAAAAAERAQAILSRCEEGARNLTAGEKRDFDAAIAETTRLRAEADAVEAGERAEIDAAEAQRQGYSGAGAGAGDWRDITTGQKVRCLAPGERLSHRTHDHDQPSVGQVLRGIACGRLGERELRGLGSAPGVSGGYLLSESLSAELIDFARNNSVAIAAGARTIPMPTGDLALAAVTSDPAINWVAEAAEIPEDTAMAFGRLNLSAKKATCLLPISRELARDAANAPAAILGVVAAAIGAAIDAAIFAGIGAANQPLGLATWPGLPEVDAASALINWDQLLDALALVEAGNGTANAWCINPATLGVLRKRKDGEGRYDIAPSDLTALGRFVSKNVPSAKVFVGDFAKVFVGVRQEVEIDIDTSHRFNRDQTCLRVTWRGDVAVVQPGHIARVVNLAA